MNIHEILQRIDARSAKLGLSARAVSLRAGMSGDGIRNWKRRMGEGDGNPGMNMSSLAKVAEALGVSQQWLLSGEDDSAAGLAEDATPFTFRPTGDADPVRALFGAAARNPAITHRAGVALPDFAIWPGDLLVCDLARPPEVGEIVIAVVIDEQTGTGGSLVRRYLPPWLIPGDSGTNAAPESLNTNTVTVRYPVIGTIRGTGAT